MLLSVLRELSQSTSPTEVGPTASDRLRAAFLLHGSTASESWQAIDRLEWTAGRDDKGRTFRHGITFDGIFLSDLYEEMTAPHEIPAHIKTKYPQLTLSQYLQATRFTWLLLSSVQWFDELAAVENDPDYEAQKELYLSNYIEKLHHFRKKPEDFL